MFSIIVAIDKNNLIGKGNSLPWHYPEDLKYFKETTLNKKVAMGYNTYRSIFDRIKKPLPKRTNIVFSKNNIDDIDMRDVIVCSDLDKFIKKNIDSDEEIFIIGGSSIYEKFIPFASKLYITHINESYDGDVYFPKIDYSLYNEKLIKENENLKFKVYLKRSK